MKKQNSRKDFLLNAAGFLTAAALSQYCSTVSKTRYSGSESVEPLTSAHDLGLTDPILIVLNAGISAPNPHNTQAWKFKVHSTMSALLYVDEDRVLPATDPTYRQIHIGQGCFLELASIAAGTLGMELNIKLLPEGYRLPVDLGRKPIAKLELKPGTGQKADPLAAMIGKRHTVRSAYDGPLITESEFTQLLELTNPGCQLRRTPESDLQRHLEFHMKGFEIEMADFPAAEESRLWFRIGDDEIYTKRDGISLAGNGVSGFQKWLIETFFLSHDPEDYYDPSGQKMFLDRYRSNLFSVKGQVLFITPQNRVEDWILVGRDYARFQLAVHTLGLVMRPTSQLMQEFDSMKKLASEYNSLLGLKSPAKLQMNALLGRSGDDFLAPRRTLQSMLR